ncbi:biotin transporter BioY [Streptococcus parasanguinis]
MKKTFPLVLIAIGTAMICVLSQFTVPFGPIPLTLQTLMIGIIGTIYKPSHAFVTVCLYLLLGFLGFPVFAGGAGGASHFLGPTAGFLLFFPFRAWITSLFTSAKSSVVTIFLANLFSSVLLFISGFIGFMLVTNKGIQASYATVVAPFILADLIKLIIITITSKAIFASLKHHWYFK